MEYLRGNIELANEKEKKKIFQRARGHIISEGELFKSGITSPWLKCISTPEGIELLKEIHFGFCGSHIGFRQLVSKAFRQGFFWPTVLKDAQHIVKTCQACQMMGPKSSKPSEPTQLIPPTWPLQRWGISLVGPLPTAQGNYKYAAVAIEYFTK